MLFALDWMKNVWDGMVSWLLGLTNDISTASISSVLTSHWLLLIGCLLAGLALCFGGFRCHKLVLGLTGGVLGGLFGWQLGCMISGRASSTPVVYATFFVISGFFVAYLLYFGIVFSGGWLLFAAILPLFSEALHSHKLWIAAVLAVAYSAIYIKYKLVMSAVSGALVLGILAFSLSPAAGAVIACACIPGGICVQRILKRKYDERKVRERQEELEKYPYGPGIAYGWPEPKSKV